MQYKPHIVLLPGLDGTGELFSPIIPFLEKRFDVHVVKYTNEVTLNDHVQSAANQLPSNSCMSLIAESFSGPIAISLLARNESNFYPSVLSASFCKSPLPRITLLSKYLPEIMFTSNLVSQTLLDMLAIGTGSNLDVRNRARKIIDKISPNQLQTRIKLLNEVNVSNELKDIKVPLLYIQATKDKIVSKNSAVEIMKNVKDLKIERVEGPHMILQTQPEKCAELIINHVNSYRRLLDI